MATKKNVVPSLPKTADLATENAQLRKMVDAQSQTEQALLSRLASVSPRVSASELMVGIRNISDNTIGLKSPFANEPPIQLHADVGDDHDPARVSAISYAWYQRLKTSGYMQRGLIMRDDSILTGSYTAAPVDREQDIHPEWKFNAVIDPREWIESRDEARIRKDINKMTSPDSLRRLRRVVDSELGKLQKKFASDPNPAKRSVDELPIKYRLVDELTTSKLEA
jgi:hypothetical protein